MTSDAYLMAVARRTGCPEPFQDDCVQEMRIALWLAPDAPWRVVVKRTAIDFVRKYGAHGRYGGSRETVSIHELPLGYVMDLDGYLYCKWALDQITPKQRDALLDDSNLGHGVPAQQRRGNARLWGRKNLRRILEAA